jgi:hypothetical protein
MNDSFLMTLPASVQRLDDDAMGTFQLIYAQKSSLIVSMLFGMTYSSAAGFYASCPRSSQV